MTDLDQELELIIKAKPWLHPELEPDSYWIVTSEDQEGYTLLRQGGVIRTTLIECLCCVSYEGGEGPVFVGPNDTFVAQSRVARATRVLIVRADDPHRAAYAYMQDDVDEAFARRNQ